MRHHAATRDPPKTTIYQQANLFTNFINSASTLLSAHVWYAVAALACGPAVFPLVAYARAASCWPPQGNMSVAFGALAQMPALVNVDFTNNYNLKGSWTGNTTYNTQDSTQVGDRPAAAMVARVTSSRPVRSHLVVGGSKAQLAARRLVIRSVKLCLTTAS